MEKGSDLYSVALLRPYTDRQLINGPYNTTFWLVNQPPEYLQERTELAVPNDDVSIN